MDPGSAPFFVIGHPRSGTTLLRMILSTHPQIYIPEESGFIPFLGVNPQQALTTQEVRMLLNHIGKLNVYWRDILTADEIAENFSPPVTLPQVINRLYEKLAQEHGAVRWGDKTPLYIQYIPKIQEIFPSAVFIHIIRDGRDAALSGYQKWGQQSPYMDIYYLLRNWVRNVRTGRREGSKLGPVRYLEVHYEALVTRPEAIIPKLCDFLEIEFHSSMLDHTQVARTIGTGHAQHHQVLQPVFQSSIGRWQTDFNDFEKKLAERIAGECLVEFGYPRPWQSGMSLSEHLKYAGLTVKFWFFDTTRSLLYRTGRLTLNRSMRYSGIGTSEDKLP